MRGCFMEVHAQPGMDILVEVLQQGGPGRSHAGADLLFELSLQGIERRIDFGGCPAGLVDFPNPLLEINSGLQCSQHLVQRSKDPVKQPELLKKDLENPQVGFILAV